MGVRLESEMCEPDGFFFHRSHDDTTWRVLHKTDINKSESKSMQTRRTIS